MEEESRRLIMQDVKTGGMNRGYKNEKKGREAKKEMHNDRKRILETEKKRLKKEKESER